MSSSNPLASALRLPALALLLAASWQLPLAQAALVTFDYSGSFASQSGFADPVINFSGATISGSYTFESTTAGAGDPLRTYSNVLTALSGTVIYGGGALSFSFNALTGNIQVEDNFVTGGGLHRDRYVVQAGGGSGITDNLADYLIQSFNMTLVQTAAAPNNAIVGLDLPLVPPDIDLFSNKTISLNFTQQGKTGPQGSLQFNLTGLTTTTRVPEPATLALLAAGLLFGVLVLHRQSRRRIVARASART